MKNVTFMDIRRHLWPWLRQSNDLQSIIIIWKGHLHLTQRRCERTYTLFRWVDYQGAHRALLAGEWMFCFSFLTLHSQSHSFNSRSNDEINVMDWDGNRDAVLLSIRSRQIQNLPTDAIKQMNFASEIHCMKFNVWKTKRVNRIASGAIIQFDSFANLNNYYQQFPWKHIYATYRLSRPARCCVFLLRVVQWIGHWV